MTAPAYRTHRNGAREVYNVDRYRRRTGAHLADIATCGTCGRSWDDSHASGVTPTPSGRCPFEYSHRQGGARENYSAKVRRHALRIMAAPPFHFEAAYNLLPRDLRADVEKECDAIAQAGAFASAYLTSRYSGLGDHGHELAMKRAHAMRKRARRILGYTQP
jgi:hypothetical protein